jgi:S-adenosyl methyltransferase
VLDTRTPSVARAYDYLLGGEACFAADRALAGRLLALYPRLADTLITARERAADAVAVSVGRGVDQYLDIGAGLPTRPSTHATARAVLPGARVAYVDRDPAVVSHGAALVPPGVRYHDGDLAEPEALLAALSSNSAPAAARLPAPAASGFIDFSRPVCLVLGLVVQALEPGTARAVVGVLVRALAAGSCLVVTAGTGDGGRLPDSVWPASPAEADLAGFFGGLDLLPPGVSRVGDVLCAIGVKPHPAGARG